MSSDLFFEREWSRAVIHPPAVMKQVWTMDTHNIRPKPVI